MLTDYVSPAHIIARINDLMYRDNLVPVADVSFLAGLKRQLRELEQQTSKDTHAIKQPAWDGIEDLKKLDDALTAINIAMQHKIVAILNSNLKELITRVENANYQRLLDIDADIRALLEVMKLQQKQQLSNLVLSRRTAAFYKILESLHINFVASSQVSDPLFGGYRKTNEIKLGNGICGGKVITWIYICAEQGSPKYPMYAESGEHWHQENQLAFFDACAKPWENISIIDGMQRLAKELIPGKFYLLAIYAKAGGHGLGLRKRHDNVVEFFDPNYGNSFALNDQETKLMIYLHLAQYILFGHYDSATLYRAIPEDLDKSRRYIPDRNTLNKTSLQINTEKEELKKVDRISLLIENFYAKKSTLDAATLQRGHQYFLALLLLYIEQLTCVAAIEKLTQTVETHAKEITSTIKPLLQERLKLIKHSEFQSALTERNNLLRDYRQQEELLQAQMNELRDQAFQVVAKKEPALVSSQKLFSITEKMRQFSQLLIGVKKTDIVEKIVSAPITAVGNFLKDSLTKFKNKFFNSKEKTQKAIKQAEAPTSTTKARVEFHQLLTTILMHSMELQPQLLHRHNIALKESGITRFTLLELNAKYKVIIRYLDHLQQTIRDLQVSVLTDFSEAELQKIVQFEYQLSTVLTLSSADRLAFKNESNAQILLEKLIWEKIPKSEIDNEKMELSVPDDKAALCRDKQLLLIEIKKIISYLNNHLDSHKRNLPQTILAAAEYLRDQKTIESTVTQFITLYDNLNKLHLHTDVAVQEYRNFVRELLLAHPKLFMNDLQLHHDFHRLIKEHYLKPPALSQNDILKANEFQRIYDKLIIMRDHYRGYFSQITSNSVISWIQTSTHASLDIHLSGQYYYAASKAVEVLSNKFDKWIHPLTLAKALDAGPDQLIQQLKTEFLELDAWFSGQQLDRLLTKCFMRLTKNQITSPKLKRTLNLINYFEQIVQGQELFLSHQPDQQQLFSANHIRVLNLAAKENLAIFCIHQFQNSWDDFHYSLKMVVQFFSDHINFDNLVNMKYRIAACEIDHYQPLVLMKLAENTDLIIVKNDIDELQINQRHHLRLLNQLLQQDSSEMSSYLQQQLKMIETHYLDSNLFPSMREILNYMENVSEVIPVYNMVTMRLHDDYDQRVTNFLRNSNVPSAK